ncbi:MAG TPA: SLBB domain-containing protein [Phenylobacterium sp.]
MRKLLSVGLAAMLAGGVASGALAQQPGEPAPSASVPVSGAPVDISYILGAGDVIDIGLVGRNDFGSRARVNTDGMILLPYVGSIKAEGRTVLGFADDVRQALIKGGFFADPVVRADVVGVASRYVTVLGAVGSPGLMPLDRSYRLSEILAKVGGRTGSGAEYVLLTRAAGGEPQRYGITALASGTAEQDPTVGTGDKIFIPSIENEVFYISGQVRSPGTFPVSAGLTYRMAIAKGGGVGENGSEKKLKVVRKGEKLKKVKLEDLVQPGDIITIGERLF